MQKTEKSLTQHSDTQPAIAENTDAADTGSAAFSTIATVNLDAIVSNYRFLAATAPSAQTAAVLKADAYGLGLAPVARALLDAGCTCFFVAQFSEAAALRAVAPSAQIYVLNGIVGSPAEDFANLRLRPVLNSLRDIANWRMVGGPRPGAILNIDTGMNRLGLSRADLALLQSEPERLEGVEIDFLMSHLACADQPDHPMNTAQLHRFQSAREAFPHLPGTLSNTAGCLLGTEFHFDLTRVGIGLFGGNPRQAGENPFRDVLTLQTPILQLREIDSTECVGYGATYQAKTPRRIAITGLGYADGCLRTLGNFATGWIAGHDIRMVGQVSMDLTAFDVTGVPAELCREGSMIELIGPNAPIDRLARSANTISYEILTRLGNRIARNYISDRG